MTYVALRQLTAFTWSEKSYPNLLHTFLPTLYAKAWMNSFLKFEEVEVLFSNTKFWLDYHTHFSSEEGPGGAEALALCFLSVGIK